MLIAFFKIRPETYVNLYFTCEYSSLTENGETRLGNKEFQVLEMLMLNRNILISTEKLMERIWGFDAEAEISVVWVYISYIRKKLASVGADVEIKASRGVGYTLEVKE